MSVDKSKLVVSLTTTSYRVQTVSKVIESLLHQTVQPAKIVLWLSKEPYMFCKGIDPSSLPADLVELEQKNAQFVVKWTKNTGSYRKLLPSVAEWPDFAIITVDDDVCYASNLIESMLLLANTYPNCVISNRSRKCMLGTPYKHWPLIAENKVVIDKWLLPTGLGGVLYPPNSCKMLDESKKDAYLHLAPRCDDIWFRILTMSNGYNVLHSGNKLYKESITDKQTDRKLFVDNVTKYNDDAFSKVCELFSVAPNKQQDANFSSKNYWQQRYSKGGNSGAGSYGKLAQFKADVLNGFCADYKDDVELVIEMGVGDGNQASLFTECKEYIGVDVSSKAIELARARMPNRRFVSYDGTVTAFKNLGLPIADLVLSLDVLFHLIEDSVFENYMQTLWCASQKFIIVYSSNVNRKDATHVRHRHWTDWVKQRGASVHCLKQKYPHESASDFFFVCKPTNICPAFCSLQATLLQQYTSKAFASNYEKHAKCLIDIVKTACAKSGGSKLEGNILFRHHTDFALLDTNLILDCMRSKRDLLHESCKSGTNGVEIGFNCGFSLLLLLLANPAMNFVVFDMFEHCYAMPCFEYLKGQFKDRIVSYVAGDSCQSLPKYLQEHAAAPDSIDFFHIDGGHSYEIALSDLSNCASMAKNGAAIVLDDFNLTGPQRAWKKCLDSGIIKQIKTSQTAGSKYFSVQGCFQK